MHVPAGEFALVTDASKAPFLKNDGDGEFPNLHLVQKWKSEIGREA